MVVLVDSSVFCAYANVRDVHHENAKRLIGEIVSRKHGSGLTTDYIFDETVSVVLRKSGKNNAINIGRFLLNSEIQLAKVDELLFQKAWHLFQNSDNLGFTDCTSVAFVQTFGIKNIATFDKGFRGLKNIEVLGV